MRIPDCNNMNSSTNNSIELISGLTLSPHLVTPSILNSLLLVVSGFLSVITSVIIISVINLVISTV